MGAVPPPNGNHDFASLALFPGAAPFLKKRALYAGVANNPNFVVRDFP
jgi:hypothetical protein